MTTAAIDARIVSGTAKALERIAEGSSPCAFDQLFLELAKLGKVEQLAALRDWRDGADSIRRDCSLFITGTKK